MKKLIMKWIKLQIPVWVFLILLPLAAHGEEIANYADCDVCHGTILLTVPETKELLGIMGLPFLLKIPVSGNRQVKIDLDGIQDNGNADTPDDGYEIKIWGSDVFYIKDLRDDSYIQMITARRNLINEDNLQSYQPRIYLAAGHDHEISLSDTVDDAWEKLRHSHIYQWVGQTENKQEWLLLLRKKIFQAIDLISQPG